MRMRFSHTECHDDQWFRFTCNLHVTGRKVTNAERFDLKLGAPRLSDLNQYYAGCLKISDGGVFFYHCSLRKNINLSILHEKRSILKQLSIVSNVLIVMVGGRFLISSQVEIRATSKSRYSLVKRRTSNQTYKISLYTEIVAVYGYMLKILTFLLLVKPFYVMSDMQTFFWLWFDLQRKFVW